MHRLLAGSALLLVTAYPVAQSGIVHAAPARSTVTIKVKAFEYKFKLSKKSVPAGTTVKFMVTDTGKSEHNFSIKGKSTPLLQPGQTVTLTVSFPKAGNFSYKCTVLGHAELGMKGKFKVTS